jgi:hypothetical protein
MPKVEQSFIFLEFEQSLLVSKIISVDFRTGIKIM